MEQDKFSIFIPLEIEKSGKTGEDRYANMKFKGIASNPNLGDDKQGQWLDPSGFDLNDFIKSGTFNWHHRWKDKPTAIVGEPTAAKVTRNNELYVEGTLYKSSQVARDIYDLAETLQTDSPTRRIGMSIEGIPTHVDPKNKNRILKARLTNIALTPAPICPGTSMEIMKGGIEDLQFEDKEDFLIDITDEHGTRWTVDKNLTLEKAEQSEELEKGRKALSGEERTWGGKRYKKDGDKWKLVGKNSAREVKLDKNLISFLDKHKFSREEIEDSDYVSEKVHNYYEYSGDDEVSDKEALMLAKQYLENKSGIKKAMEAGSITGTETHNQSLTQQPLKKESIAGTEGKKKKKKKVVIENITEMTKAEVIEYLSDLDMTEKEKNEVFGLAQEIEKGEVKKKQISKAQVFTQLISESDLDIESAKHVYQLAEAIEKAEGDRGGKVIGHTKSGNPIYDHVKAGVEAALGRKVRMNHVDRGMGDQYHQFDVADHERDKVHNYFKNHPNNKKSGSKDSYDGGIGYIDHESGTAGILNPATNKKGKMAIRFHNNSEKKE